MYSTREISLDAMRKPARNKGKHTEGQHMETLGSAREHDWVVGSQILTESDHDESITTLFCHKIEDVPVSGKIREIKAIRSVGVVDKIKWSESGSCERNKLARTKATMMS